MTPTTYNQIHEIALMRAFFKSEPFFKGETLIVWPQELNVEISDYFKGLLRWWVEVKEDEQFQSMYTVFNVTVNQAREFLIAAHDDKWGIGASCFVFMDGDLSWGRD